MVSGEIYKVSASMGVDTKTMHGYDVAMDTCSVWHHTVEPMYVGVPKTDVGRERLAGRA